MSAPLITTSLLGSLASLSTIAIVTTNIGPSLASAGLRFSTAQNTIPYHVSTRRNIHTVRNQRYAPSHYQSSSPVVSRRGILQVRTTSQPIPLDQRATFWHRSYRSGKSPYDDASPFKSASDAERLHSVEQHWAKNIEKMNKVHEMMRKRHMDFMKRRLESEPYDVLFGWRNRMRAGLPQQMWVKGSDVLKANNASADTSTQPAGDKTTVEQPVPSATTLQSSPVPRDMPEQQSASTTQHQTLQRPVVQSSTSTHEYDPIANRMVHKRVDIIGHLQASEQSTATSTPTVESLRQESVDTLRAEFQQWRAAKLSETLDSAVEQPKAPSEATRSSETASSMAKIASRARLEDSFQKVHKQPAEFVKPEDFSRRLQSSKVGDENMSQTANTETAQSSGQFESALESLAARIKVVGDRVEKLQQQGSVKESANAAAPTNQVENEEQLRQKFREFRKLTGSLAESAIKPADAPKSISFRQLPKSGATDASTVEARKGSPQHVYEILAYDPLTSEVTTTTVSAPEAAKEQVIGLSEALSRLSEPAKFLPHLRLLKDREFEPVTATKNMLVLRGRPNDAVAPDKASFAAEAKAADGSADPVAGHLGEPRLANYFTADAKERLRARRWRRGRRFGKAIIFWSMIYAGLCFLLAGGAAYVYGVTSGYGGRKSKQSSSEKLPDTEEAMYRALRESNKSSRKDPYSGMRRVTYPKESEG